MVEWFDDCVPGDLEPAAQIIPDRDAELVAGFAEAEESIAAIPPDVTPRSAADLPPRDVASDVILRSVGVQRNFRPFEHHQQLGLVGIQPRKQAIQRDEAGAAQEDTVETPAQYGGPALAGVALSGCMSPTHVPKAMSPKHVPKSTSPDARLRHVPKGRGRRRGGAGRAGAADGGAAARGVGRGEKGGWGMRGPPLAMQGVGCDRIDTAAAAAAARLCEARETERSYATQAVLTPAPPLERAHSGRQAEGRSLSLTFRVLSNEPRRCRPSLRKRFFARLR